MKALFLYNQTTCGASQIAATLGCSTAVIKRVVKGQSPYQVEYEEYKFLQSNECIEHPLHKAAIAVQRLYEGEQNPSTYEIIQALESAWPQGLDCKGKATASRM